MENSQARELSLQRRLVAYKTYAAWQEVPHAVYQYEPDATEFFSEFRKLKEGFAGGSSLLEIQPMYKALDNPVLDFGNMRA